MHRTPLSVAAALVAALSVSACSGAASTTDTFNDADVQYAKDVISAHQRTIALADLATAKTADPTVLASIAGDDTEARAEITMLARYLKSWGQPDPPELDLGQHVAEADDPLIQGQAELEALRGLEGAKFDRAFLLTTVAHNREYVAHAQRQLDDGYDKLTLGLARSISIERSGASTGIETALGG